MNELPPSSELNAHHNSLAPHPPASFSSHGHESRVLRLIYGVLALLTFVLLAQWWGWHSQISHLRAEVAQRLKNGDTINTETKVLVKTLQDTAHELQGKVSVLENRQQEAQSQQLALEQLYQDLSRNRDDWALAEIEQVLSTASQQLQLSGNVRGALIALQNADSRLANADKPQFINVRRAIAKDLDRLKALPSVDITGVAVRLDSAIAQIDAMPLLSDEKPVVPVAPPKQARAVSTQSKATGSAGSNNKEGVSANWTTQLRDKWDSLSNEIWTDVRQLIRVRSVETPSALLLSPSEAFYARENLKLRLLNARLALLTRNENAFRSDLNTAQDEIAKFFDTRARQTQTTQALLRQVQATNVSIEMPSLADSLNAVRNYKAKP